jgi:putative transposase
MSKGAPMPVFWRCYYHLVWTTKHRAPLITLQVEPVLFQAIREKCRELAVEIIAVNAVEDHIHIAVEIPPKLSIANWVKHIKGASSYAVNSHFPNTEMRFQWQTGYGVLTFGATALPMVTDYINNQKRHHANKTLEPYLEQTGEDE